jgi:hypothetical protein
MPARQLDSALLPTLSGGRCPHMAVMLGSPDELHPVLAAFYALGVKRGGWVVHRARPGEVARDRGRLTDAGLDCGALEAGGKFVIAEFDLSETPEQASERWLAELERALASGFSALWYSRFVLETPEEFAASMPFDQAWDRDFEGRPVVTLCPYIAEPDPLALPENRGSRALVDHQHDDVLVFGETGFTRHAGRSAAA